MEKFCNTKIALAVLALGLPLSYGSLSYAAKPIDLSKQHPALLQQMISTPTKAAYQASQIKEISRTVDMNQTLHVRIQQTYHGYPIWGGDAVVHTPQVKNAKAALDKVMTKDSFMNGTFYQQLENDLAGTQAQAMTAHQAKLAADQGIKIYSQTTPINASDISAQKSELIIFIDDHSKAHWAYKVSLDIEPTTHSIIPSKPVYILDAQTFNIYAQWNDIKNLEDNTNSEVFGGGFGGNKKMGKLVYDGLKNHLEKFNLERDDENQMCFMKNQDVLVTQYGESNAMSFECGDTDIEHNDVYWNGSSDQVNDGYSPRNDAMFGGIVIKDMYQKWYKVPVLKNRDGTPMVLHMVVHVRNYDNAYWDGKKMTFGDGQRMFYPLTSLGVAAHEISHGFTEQHANLAYYGQSGGMNEAFSDMAAQAAEIYAYGKNSWQIGPEIFKKDNAALRYMDKPSKDCGPGKEPGDWCSIDHVSQYFNGLDVHFSSGIYNRMFYNLGTTKGWNTKKAFDVMVLANQNYWTSSTNFEQGACGALKAAKDLKYDIKAVEQAFSVVGVKTDDC